jgi:hypothetical protein
LRVLRATRKRSGRRPRCDEPVGDALDIGLGTKNAGIDSGTRAGIVKVGHRRPGMFDGDLQRRAELLTVERPVTQLVGPDGRAEGIVALALRIEIAMALTVTELNRRVGISFT